MKRLCLLLLCLVIYLLSLYCDTPTHNTEQHRPRAREYGPYQKVNIISVIGILMVVTEMCKYITMCSKQSTFHGRWVPIEAFCKTSEYYST